MSATNRLLLGIPIAVVLSVTAAMRAAPPAEYAQVQQVFDAKCTACHAGAEAARGLRLESWEHVTAGSAHGEAVIAFDAENSLLIEIATKLVGGPHPSELGADRLTDDEVALLREWVEGGARSPAGNVPFAGAEQLLYVTNQGAATVSVIDMETNMVIRTVDLKALGFPSGAMPHHIAVEPDGSFWYVSLIVANTVLKFNRQNELVGRTAFEWPGLMALDPASDNLYVARSMIAVSPPTAVGIVRRSDMTVEEIGVLMPRPHALAVGPGGRTVFTSSLAVNQIGTLYPDDEFVELTNLGGDRPHTFIGFAVSPDGHTMVGTTELTSKLFVFDLDRAPDMVPVDTIDVQTSPWHPVFTPDGRWVYVGNNWSNNIAVIDMQAGEVVKIIEGRGIAQPHGSAVSPDGRYVYISSRNLQMPEGHSKAGHVYRPRYDLGDNAHIGTVVVIDTDTQTIVKIIEVEEYASGMGTATRMSIAR